MNDESASERRPRSQRYPTTHMPLAAELAVSNERFEELREEFLLDYTYNTARAYWSDLEQIHDWAVERGKDTLALTNQDLKQYVALLRRRKYSENTVLRRQNVWRRFATGVVYESSPDQNEGTPGKT